MTSIANAIIIYGLLKYRKQGGYPMGFTFLAAAITDILIASVIAIGL